MSKVINLSGGAGVGKTTLAAEIFVKMRKMGLSCDLVQEYVKAWSYENRPISTFDQFYLVGKQIKKESILYGRVDYIITDSPLWLGAVYDNLMNGTNYIEQHVDSFTGFAKTKGVEYYDFLLDRIFLYDPVGRYGDEENAKKVDSLMKSYLERKKYPYEFLDMAPELRADYIIKKVS